MVHNIRPQWGEVLAQLPHRWLTEETLGKSDQKTYYQIPYFFFQITVLSFFESWIWSVEKFSNLTSVLSHGLLMKILWKLFGYWAGCVSQVSKLLTKWHPDRNNHKSFCLALTKTTFTHCFLSKHEEFIKKLEIKRKFPFC